jgi:type IV secretory pathway VirB10-like protein
MPYDATSPRAPIPGAPHPRRPDPRRARRRPAAAEVDRLERRALLSASLAADGTLLVVGGEGPDQVTLRRAASDPNLLQVQEGATSLFVFLLDRVRSVSVDLGGGDDVFNLDSTPGLVTGNFANAPGDMTINVTGGAGNDSILLFGAAPAPIHQVFTVGPDAGSGTHVSRTGTDATAASAAGPAQALKFAGFESVADTSIAATLTIVGNDGPNAVELSTGPLAGGITPTATVRFYDVTPGSAAPQAAAANPAPVEPAATTPPTAAVDPNDPAARREAKRQAKQAKLEAKRKAREARLEAKRLAREQKLAAKLARQNGTAAPMAAAATAPETLLIDRAHAPLHFANKTAVVIHTAGGNDRLDVNLAGAAPAGLAALTLDGGAGADRVCTPAVPAGVVLATPGVEATATLRDFVLTPNTGPVGEVPTSPNPPAPEPPIPTEPPPPPAGSAATGSHDRDDDDKNASASASASASSTANASASRDASSSKDKNASGTNDEDGDDDNDKGKDSNASNDD